MLIVDTSVLIAAANRRERHHRSCAQLLRAEETLVLPAPVVTETCMMLRRRYGPHSEARFLSAVAGGDFRIAALDSTAYERTATLVSVYRELPLGFVDAAIVAVAERLGCERVASLDHRDFRVVRPAHIETLTLLP